MSGKVRLIRINPDGKLEKRKINYRKRNKVDSFSNPLLRERDIIYINKSGFNIASSVISEVTSPFLGIYATYNVFEPLFD